MYIIKNKKQALERKALQKHSQYKYIKSNLAISPILLRQTNWVFPFVTDRHHINKRHKNNKICTTQIYIYRHYVEGKFHSARSSLKWNPASWKAIYVHCTWQKKKSISNQKNKKKKNCLRFSSNIDDFCEYEYHAWTRMRGEWITQLDMLRWNIISLMRWNRPFACLFFFFLFQNILIPYVNDIVLNIFGDWCLPQHHHQPTIW